VVDVAIQKAAEVGQEISEDLLDDLFDGIQEKLAKVVPGRGSRRTFYKTSKSKQKKLFSQIIPTYIGAIIYEIGLQFKMDFWIGLVMEGNDIYVETDPELYFSYYLVGAWDLLVVKMGMKLDAIIISA